MYLINGRVGAGNPEMEVSWSPMQNAWLQIVDLTINSDWPTVVMQLNTSQGFGTYHYWVKGTEISVNWLGAPGWAKFVVRTDDVPPSAGPFNNGRNGDDFLISIQLDGNNLYCSRNFHIDP